MNQVMNFFLNNQIMNLNENFEDELKPKNNTKLFIKLFRRFFVNIQKTKYNKNYIFYNESKYVKTQDENICFSMTPVPKLIGSFQI